MVKHEDAVGGVDNEAYLGRHRRDQALFHAARLGDALLERGLVTPEALERALAHQKRVGATLGTILLTQGSIKRQDLYSVLGDLWDVPTMEVDHVDPELAKLFDSAVLAQENWVPVRYEERDGERVVIVGACALPTEEIAQKVRDVTGVERVEQYLTTDWDVRNALRTAWREQLVDRAVNDLRQRNPDESASRVITRRQVVTVAVLLVLLIVGLVVWTGPTLMLLLIGVNLAFTASVAAKQVVGLAGAANEDFQLVVDSEVDELDDSELPRYTILVPAYKEADIVGLLMQNLAQLDYPHEKMEIILLLEEDDPETVEAAKRAMPPDIVRFLVVPHAIPKTKPKACNVGLMFATGEFVVIYDAEDRPEPDQLKKAVVAFRKGGEDLVCVQAALNYFNASENLLTRMFTLEYSSWFDYTLSGLDRLNLPIPLGGTSNHFRTDMLRELGGWDPYNVTEDADLGIRAAARGYQVKVVNSTTFEEANNAYGNWIRQRSRWIKGYMQTFLVHTRHPVKLYRQIGLKQVLGFLLLIGGTPMSFLAGPVLWLLFGASLVFPVLLAGMMPYWLLVVCLANLCLGNGMILYLALISVLKRRQYGLAGFALLNPLYWTMHSIASYKALWQLIRNPFYWEKTTHGITKHVEVEG